MPFRPSSLRFSTASSTSSRKWLSRQHKDPLVKQRLSSPESYRSRSAYKLVELDAQYKFLRHSDVQTVIDLGAAPGGWSQVVSTKFGWGIRDAGGMEGRVIQDLDGPRRVEETTSKNVSSNKRKKHNGRRSAVLDETWDPLDELLMDESLDVQQSSLAIQEGRGTIIAVDLLPVVPIPGVQTLQMDFLAPETTSSIHTLIPANAQGKVDVILSDMAANFTGNRVRDVEASMDINNAVFEFARRHLRTAASIGRRQGGVLL